MSRRHTLIISGSGLLIIFGGIQTGWVTNNCSPIFEGCYTVWIVSGIVILSTILLIESLIARKRPLIVGNKQDNNQINSNSSSNTNRYVWQRAIARVILSSLILGLPLWVQGAFIVIFTGPFIGMGFDFFIRGIMGWLPPLPPESTPE